MNSSDGTNRKPKDGEGSRSGDDDDKSEKIKIHRHIQTDSNPASYVWTSDWNGTVCVRHSGIH